MDELKAAALDLAWQILEEERNSAADRFMGADDEFNKANAKFAYMGYCDAMNVLRHKAAKLKKQTSGH